MKHQNSKLENKNFENKYFSLNGESMSKVILTHYSLVEKVVSQLRLSQNILFSQDDFIQFGILGLIDAINLYDEEKQTKFENFAVPKIRGRIIDELRKTDMVPRKVRDQGKHNNRAIREIECLSGRECVKEEVAEKLDISLESYEKLLVNLEKASAYYRRMYDSKQRDEEDLLNDFENVEKLEAENFLEIVQENETKDMLVDIISKLKERDRIIISLYFYEGVGLSEIGEILGLSVGRISQVLDGILSLIRKELKAKL